MNAKQNTIAEQLKAIDAIKEEDIDYSDAPDCSDEDWTQFKPFQAEKKSISIRLDTDVIEYFKLLGGSYQSKINMVLREYKRHQTNI